MSSPVLTVAPPTSPPSSSEEFFRHWRQYVAATVGGLAQGSQYPAALVPDAVGDVFLWCLERRIWEKFDPSRGVTWKQFLAFCLRNKWRNYLRGVHRRPRLVLSDPAPLGEVNQDSTLQSEDLPPGWGLSEEILDQLAAEEDEPPPQSTRRRRSNPAG